MAVSANLGISRSLLRRELSELDAYMERVLFFFHVAPALVRHEQGERRFPEPARVSERLLPAIDRRVLPAGHDRVPFPQRRARSWLPGLF